MTTSSNHCELILALDVPTINECRTLLEKTGTELKWVKVGLQLYTKYGPEIVHTVSGMGYQVFLDLKLYDIPNTVASAIKSLKDLPIGLLTLHASGGGEMMRWADEARKEIEHPMKLLGVTVLTSMDQSTLNTIGVDHAPEDQVMRLANLAIASGIDGIVSSPLELSALRTELGPEPMLVTPGIRPKGADANEQKRIMTPADAAALGASHIVVGRPISKAPDPSKAVSDILEELKQPI